MLVLYFLMLYVQTILTVLLFHVKKIDINYQSEYKHGMFVMGFGFLASIQPAYVKNIYTEKVVFILNI